MESFPALDVLPSVTARFIGSIPAVAVAVERPEAMTRLAPYHQRLLQDEGLGTYPLVTAEQVHGNKIAVVDETKSDFPITGVDGLLTQKRGITLGISVADCAPVWIVARNGTAGALLHSGKKGTYLGIVPNGIAMLCNLTGLSSANLILVIGPCIRPPCYEVDFAAEIRLQAKQAGVLDIHDDGVCTACHSDRYYSYRKECGLTGRMLATLTLLPA